MKEITENQSVEALEMRISTLKKQMIAIKKENKELQSRLDATEKERQRYEKAFKDYADNPGVEEVMQTLFEDIKSDYANCWEFCEDYCPFDVCEYDCFAKEQLHLCEELACQLCKHKTICPTASTGNKEDRITDDTGRCWQ